MTLAQASSQRRWASGRASARASRGVGGGEGGGASRVQSRGLPFFFDEGDGLGEGGGCGDVASPQQRGLAADLKGD